jgi:hypothetical protein
MIVSLHVATGAAAGTLAGTPLRALALGPLLHIAGDRMPHHDLDSRTFELTTGVGAVLLLAATRGPLDPATLGALAASAPDVEHVVPLPRPGGRKLFPSHRFHGWHRAGGASGATQLVAAGILLGALAATGRARGR